MLVFILIITVVILGAMVFYIYFVAPRINPQNRAQNFLDENRVEEAIVEFKKVLESQPYDINILWKLSELYISQGKFDQAATLLEKIVGINMYSAEVKKIDVLKNLAQIYLKRSEKGRAFEKYYEILRDYPNDPEALFQVGFMALGQESFDIAFKHLDLLAKLEKKRLDVFFGAGMAALQSQRSTEALVFFKEALSVDPLSEITNIAMAFTLNKRKDFKTATNYAKMVVDNSNDPGALFVAKRLLSMLYIEAKKAPQSIKLLEELKESSSESGWTEELKVVYYDLGFAYLLDDKTAQAYDCWNQLYQLDREFRNIQDLITRLRKEMDEKAGAKFDDAKSVLTEIDGWKNRFFPANFVWNICGLKSNSGIDIEGIIAPFRHSGVSEKKYSDDSTMKKDAGDDDLDRLYKLDAENFRRVAYRICEKLGLVIDDILTTYKDADGVDFMAHLKESSKTKVLVWVRRWKGASVGEIPLRNFAQAINDLKAQQGYFITTSPLTQAGESSLNNLGKVKVVYPEEVAGLIKGII